LGLSGTGNALNNYLIGNSAANTLTGGAGNDILDGQAGADTLVGGLGDDGYIVDNASDVIAENVGEGIDRVSSALSWTLGANVENLTLSGAGSINGTGNSLSNWLTGNAGSNVLSGLDGNDRLDGGVGNDTLVGGLGSDVYMFGKTYGVDTVQENDASAGVKDRVEFGTGIATGDTSFVRSGNDLQVLIAGTADKLVLQNWYLGNSYHVEEFAYKDGTVLTDAQVQGLVSAMAAFAAPASVDARSSDFFDGRRQRGDQVFAANAIA
jgi:Ca2+-binding RTX toxin-like protein